jgi:hydroxypyruvate isomerase
MLLINAPPPNYTGGEPGYAAIPGGEGRFQHDMRRAFRYAEALNVSFIHIVTGQAEGEEAFKTLVKNLKWASRSAPKGLTLTIEPLNPIDFPGQFLNDYGLAAKVLDAVKKSNVRLQFDAYHAQAIHGDAVEIWNRYGLRAAHAQIADTPGRTPPGKGDIDFKALFAAMSEQGYSGWIAAEYKAGERPTEETLDWLSKFRQRVA